MAHRMMCIVLLIPLGFAPPARAGVIRGMVHVSSAVAARSIAPNPYPGRAASLPGLHGTMRGAVTDAVVYVERVPAAAESALAHSGQHPRLAQKDQAFVPRVVPVAVGTAVDFPNLDPIYHNVFSLSPARRFDLGKYARGKSKTVVFDRTGLVNVYCDIHSDMEAFVLVLPHHAFTQPDAGGAFALPDLPAGRYQLKVWHPDLHETSRVVDVPATGTVTVDLSL